MVSFYNGSVAVLRAEGERGIKRPSLPLPTGVNKIERRVPVSLLEEKPKMLILSVMRDSDELVGSNDIAKALEAHGYNISSRTVRLYLQEMEDEGLVEEAKRGRSGGRRITTHGRQEIDDSLIFDRIGMTAAKVDAMAWRMRFDHRRRQGQIVLNLTILHAEHFARGAAEMVPVFEKGLGMGRYVAVIRPGEKVGHAQVPEGCVGLGTICSVTVNGVFLNERVPIVSRFGGVLEMHEGTPARFTDVIYYEGTSMDPLEVFIKAGLTSVRQILSHGHGRIGASFREVPTCALAAVERLREELREVGLDGILMLGKPNQPLLGFSVQEGRTGMIVTGGLNPAAAIHEAGIPTQNTALSCLYDFNQLIPYSDLERIGQEFQ